MWSWIPYRQVFLKLPLPVGAVRERLAASLKNRASVLDDEPAEPFNGSMTGTRFTFGLNDYWDGKLCPFHAFSGELLADGNGTLIALTFKTPLSTLACAAVPLALASPVFRWWTLPFAAFVYAALLYAFNRKLAAAVSELEAVFGFTATVL